MRCLSKSIRYNDPSWQRWLSTVAKMQTLTELFSAMWPLARAVAMHIIEAVLTECARLPDVLAPYEAWGTPVRSKGGVKRQVISLCGPIQECRRGMFSVSPSVVHLLESLPLRTR